MRISTQQFFFQGSQALSDLNAQTARLQEQLSTGRRILSASDDPGSTSRIIRLDSELERLDQFQENTLFADSRLVRTEQTITTILNVVERVRELSVRANNGSFDNQERTAFRVEFEELTQQLFNLTNERDEQGEFIFSGFFTERPAYIQNAEGDFVFNGNSGVRRLQIDNDTFIATSESGASLFENVELFFSQIEAEAGAANSAGFQLVAATIDDREAFDTVFPEDYVVQFQAENAVVPNAPNYSVIRQSDGAAIVSNAVYDPVSGINFEGLSVQTAGNPQPGDSISISSVESQNILQTLTTIASEIDSQPDAETRSNFIGGAINSLDAIRDRLSAAQTRVGVSLSTIDSTRNVLADRELAQQSLLSDIRDLDFAEAISNLSLLTFTIEASQASFARIANLSLFNFIR